MAVARPQAWLQLPVGRDAAHGKWRDLYVVGVQELNTNQASLRMGGSASHSATLGGRLQQALGPSYQRLSVPVRNGSLSAGRRRTMCLFLFARKVGASGGDASGAHASGAHASGGGASGGGGGGTDGGGGGAPIFAPISQVRAAHRANKRINYGPSGDAAQTLLPHRASASKGAVSVSMRIGASSFCFVTAHLEVRCLSFAACLRVAVCVCMCSGGATAL